MLGLYLRRALRWRCPLCGERPLFRSVGEVRSLRDWFATLAGCTGCGYAYEREPGYFLLATWGINYGVAVAVALVLYFTLSATLELTTFGLISAIAIPTAIVSLGFIRHAKALFLAFDRFLDP